MILIDDLNHLNPAASAQQETLLLNRKRCLTGNEDFFNSWNKFYFTIFLDIVGCGVAQW